MPAQNQGNQVEGAEVKTKYFREFKGVYTKAKRVACPEDNFYDLVNLIPVGHANLNTIPDLSAALVDYSSDTIYWKQYANINSTDYMILFSSTGKVFAYNIAANTSAQINGSVTLSGSGSHLDQWKNSTILIVDSTGYYSWDGTTFSTHIAGGTALPTITSATSTGVTATIMFATAPTTIAAGSLITMTGFSPTAWNTPGLGVGWTLSVPSLPSISSALVSGTTGTLTFSSAHGLLTGAIITLSGFTSLGWNATYTVTVFSATVVTFTMIAPPLVALPTIASGTMVATTATLTFNTVHGLTTGNYITLINMNPTAWNGQWQVTVTSSTVVTFTIPTAPANATAPYGSAFISSATINGNAVVNNIFTFPFTGASTSVIGTAKSPGLLPTTSFVSPDIAVFSNRVWIYSNRALYVSAINDFTDFTLVDGAVVQNLTDPQIRGQLTRLYSSNGYLYMLGKSSCFVISDVYIPQGAVPPAPVFSILNVQALIGCDQPGSVFPFNRDLMFANTYGLWKLSGVTAEKMSEDIDGTMKYVVANLAGGGQPISGGSPQIYNLLQASFLIKQVADPIFGTRTLVANYFDKKWWFADYGALTFIATGISSNQPVLFGMKGNKLYQLYQNTATAPYSKWQTSLWPMEDSLADKEVLRAGFEMVVTLINGITANIDTPNTTAQFFPPTWNQTASVGSVQWINNSSAIVQWQNNALAAVTWFSGSYLLYVGDGLGGFAKYIGITGSALAGSVYQLSSNMFDYALRKRW